MKQYTFFKTGSFCGLIAVGLWWGIASGNAQTSPNASAVSQRVYANKVASAKLFGQYMAPVGDLAPSESESKALWDAFGFDQHKDILSVANDLESFIQNNPSSSWTPTVRGKLAKAYAENGRYTPALQHFEECWEATKNMTGAGKETADFALAHWTRLMVMLGRMDKLALVYQESQGRVLDHGYLQVIYDETKEAYDSLRLFAEPGVGCGGYALAQIAKTNNLSKKSIKAILDTPMPAQGYTMKGLADLAVLHGIDLVPVKRQGDSTLVVPSIVHLLQNHYIAILAKRDDQYYVADPALGHAKWINADIINAETSENFLVPRGKIPASWLQLSDEVSVRIVGKGYATVVDDPSDTPPCEDDCDCPAGGASPSGPPGNPPGPFGATPGSASGGGSGCLGCGGGSTPASERVSEGFSGMPRWSVSEPFINLWIKDEPLGYQPAYGPRVSFLLAYKQRPDRLLDNNVFSVGKNWNTFWSSHVVPGSGELVTLYVAGGGVRVFTSDNTTPEYHSNDRMSIVYSNMTVIGYQVNHPSGAYEQYTMCRTVSTTREYYLTRKVDPQGLGLTFNYSLSGLVLRLISIVDAVGNVTTVDYDNISAYPNLISKITDPFNRFCLLSHNSDGFLIGVTDVQNLASSFGYDRGGGDAYNSITNLTTPYGTNSFKHNTWIETTGNDRTNRSIIITEPDGGKQMYQLQFENHILQTMTDTNGGEWGVYVDTNNVPDLNGWDAYPELGENNQMNMFMIFRNSFYWGRQQFANLNQTFTNSPDQAHFSILTPADYARSRVRHWNHHSGQNIGNTLALNWEPSPDTSGDNPVPGKMTWYHSTEYGSSDGDSIFPKSIMVVNPGGDLSFNIFQRDQFGNITNKISSYSGDGAILTRANRYVYWDNGVDLKAEFGPDDQLKAGYHYNDYHRVSFMTNGNNEVTSYTYNDKQQLTGVKYPNNLVVTNIYSTNGWLLSQYSYAVSNNTMVYYGTNTYYYYTNGLVRTNIDSRGLVRSYGYDNLQRVTNVSYPDNLDNTSEQYVYTNLDLVRKVDRLGGVNGFLYNSMGRLEYSTNAATNVTIYSYCVCGGVSTVEDALEGVTHYYYDNQGNRTYVHFPGDYAVTNRYDSLKRLTNVTDSAGASTSYFYNNQGLVTGISNKVGWVVRYGYDINDRINSITDANGVTVTQTYDNLDRLTTRSYPSPFGNEQWGYSANILPATTYTDQINNVIHYAYDSRGLKTNTIQAVGTAAQATNSFFYNAAGDLLVLRDGKDQPTTWDYDAYGRVLAKHDAAGTVIITNQYNANGWLTFRWTLGKGTNGYIYDKLGNLRTNSNTNQTLIYAYDALNRLTNMVDKLGTTVYAYDNGGFLQSEDGPWDYDLVSCTHTNGLRASLSLTQPGGVAAWSQSYGYDAGKRLQTLVSPAGTFSYDYLTGSDNKGSRLPAQVNLPVGYISHVYDALARLQSTSLRTPAGTAVDWEGYAYNNANQRTYLTNSAGGNYVNYAYDGRGQLTSAHGYESNGTARLSEQWGYVYDTAGNLTSRSKNSLSETFTPNTQNQITTAVGSGTLTVSGVAGPNATQVTVNGTSATLYADKTFSLPNVPVTTTSITAVATDSAGRTASDRVNLRASVGISGQYDRNGNLTNDGWRSFTFDSDNQLVSVVVSNSVTDSTKTDFVYDGRMRRRVRTEASLQGGAWVTNAVVRYVYDGMRVIQERDGSNTVSVTYTWGNDLSGSLQGAGGIGGLLARTHPGAHHFYYHSDGNGNVTAIMNPAATVVAQYRYSPYGDLIYSKGPLADINLYRFSSKEFTTNSGLYYYGFRFYDPNLQRWLNKDPLGEDGGINLYAFVDNDPVNYFDSLGLKKCYKWMLITFYTGQKPKKGRNSWNQNDLTDMDAATGLGGYQYNPESGGAKKVGPSKGRDDYAYPPFTDFNIHRGKKGTDKRTVRDGGSGWVYPRPGAPNGVGQDEWLDLWTPKPKQGIEVDLVETEVADNCPCPKGWSGSGNPAVPSNLQKIKDATGK